MPDIIPASQTGSTYNRNRRGDSNTARLLLKRYLVVISTLLLGSLISIIAFQTIIKNNLSEYRREFRSHVFQQYLLINKDIQNFHQFISDAQSFFASSTMVTLEEFQYFFQPAITQQSKFLLFAWFPADRSGQQIQALPFTVHSNVISPDTAANLLKEQAIEDILLETDSQAPFETSGAFPFVLDNNDVTVPLIAMVAPTYNYLRNRQLEEDTVPAGYILSIIRVRPFVSQVDVEGGLLNYIYVYLSDPVTGVASPIYSKGDWPGVRPEYGESIQALAENFPFSEVIEVPLGSRKLYFLFAVSPDIQAKAINWICWLVLALGLFVTLLAAVFFHLMLARNIQIRQLVEKKTKELQESEARQRAILANIADGVLTMDGAGIIHMFNPACEHIFGYKTSEVIGENIKMLIPEPYWGDLEQLSMGEESKGIVKERTGTRKGGTEFPMEISFGGLAGEEQQYVAVVRDISERKHAEAELLRSNKALDDFVYIVSHDLKEPLRSIQNFSAILLEDCQEQLDAECIEHLKTIERVATRMQGQLDSLLVYSRASHKEVTMEVVDVNNIIAEIIDSLHALIDEAEAEIEIPEALPTIRADRTSLVEIFTNLIQNAIKYRREGVAPVVTIGSNPKSQSDMPGTVLYVRDNGIGIKPEHQETVFKMFKRLHTRDAYGGGTGSGLAIVKKLVERQGGEIKLQSEPGKGSTFYFNLPDHVADAEEG